MSILLVARCLPATSAWAGPNGPTRQRWRNRGKNPGRATGKPVVPEGSDLTSTPPAPGKVVTQKTQSRQRHRLEGLVASRRRNKSSATLLRLAIGGQLGIDKSEIG